jgi:hypothetical protein
MRGFIASLVLALPTLAAADPALGPDFVGHVPSHVTPRNLSASESPFAIEPADVVAFALGDWRLGPAEVAQTERAAEWLRAHPRYRIVLEGHTDSSGTVAWNDDLASRRVHTVRDHLTASGIARDRVVMIVYGSAEASGNANPDDRRVVIYATTLEPHAIARSTLAHRRAKVVMWTDRNALYAEEPIRRAVATRR